MKQSDYQKAAFQSVKNDGYDICKSYGLWKNYHVFNVAKSAWKGCIVGIPQFVLVDDNLRTRFATLEEFNEIFYPPSSSDDSDEELF